MHSLIHAFMDQFGMMIDTTEFYILILVQLTLTSFQGYRNATKKKTPTPFVSIILQKLQLVWMEFGMLLRLVALIILINILSHPIRIQGREPYLCDFFNNKTNEKDWLVFRHLQTDFFQTWSDTRDHYTLHFDISLDDLDCHSRSQQYEKSKTVVSLFSLIWQSILMKFSMLLQPDGMVKLMLKLLCMTDIEGEKLLTGFYKIYV